MEPTRCTPVIVARSSSQSSHTHARAKYDQNGLAGTGGAPVPTKPGGGLLGGTGGTPVPKIMRAGWRPCRRANNAGDAALGARTCMRDWEARAQSHWRPGRQRWPWPVRRSCTPGGAGEQRYLPAERTAAKCCIKISNTERRRKIVAHAHNNLCPISRETRWGHNRTLQFLDCTRTQLRLQAWEVVTE